ncbi:hypothetical protein BFP76_05245 [Amylibacter kogurei]|uniref:DUF306 domain-containing protein n=1 Tax=Paramylibacter kogurei TaxID=1889778 RepID=A0A2G5K4X5_9RHOB|nr:hypothetical protein [Amylibacter kogurei]PIB24591.1 hypothetical protein BFP76_05245 [Amylibacter kogurei]
MSILKTIALSSTVLCMALTPSFAAKQGQKAGKIAVNDTFSDWGINWGSSGKYIAKILITEHNGQIIVCGTGYLKGAITANFNNQALTGTYLTMNGENILNGLRFFSNARSAKNLSKAKANCAYTKAKGPIKDSDKFLLESRRNKYWD